MPSLHRESTDSLIYEKSIVRLTSVVVWGSLRLAPMMSLLKQVLYYVDWMATQQSHTCHICYMSHTCYTMLLSLWASWMCLYSVPIYYILQLMWSTPITISFCQPAIECTQQTLKNWMMQKRLQVPWPRQSVTGRSNTLPTWLFWLTSVSFFCPLYEFSNRVPSYNQHCRQLAHSNH